MPSPPPTNPPPATRAVAEDEDEAEFNPLQFQQSLDDGIAQARSLVAAWFPTSAASGWDTTATNSGAQGLQELKDRARVPRFVLSSSLPQLPAAVQTSSAQPRPGADSLARNRLGLGASPAAYHAQQAEDRKLAKQLGINKRSATAMGDAGSELREVAVPAAAKEENGVEESDSDEAESRSRAVKGKGKATAVDREVFSSGLPKKAKKNKAKKASDAPNNLFLPAASSSSASLSGPSGSHSTSAGVTSTSSTTQPASSSSFPPASLKRRAPSDSFASTSSSASAPTPSSSSTSTLAPPSTATGTLYTAPTSAAALAGLSKNQRKKLRDKERTDALKRQREEESRREAEAEAEAEGGAGLAKRARLELEGSPAPSSVTLVASAPPSPIKGNFETGEGVEAAEGGAERGAGSDGKKKKKKKRKSKGGAGAGEEAKEEEPLLRLDPVA